MAPQGSKKGFRGMTLLQLFEDVEMHIMAGGSEMFPGGGTPTPCRPRRREVKNLARPIEISCRGPFRFDFLTNVATFKDQVDVKRENAGRSQRSAQLPTALDVLRSPRFPKGHQRGRG